MRWPDFLVIGAAKSGTTTLHHHLRAHPEVFVPARKEPKFFAFDGEPPAYTGNGDAAANADVVVHEADYLRLFEDAGSRPAAGEVSPLYLFSLRAPERARLRVPRARIVAILRQPADRAFSSWAHLVRTGRETETDFRRALEVERRRRGENRALLWHYEEGGRYHAQMRRWYDAFPADRVRVYLHDDLASDPRALLADLYGFLGVDPAFVPDLHRRDNEGWIPRRGPLRRFLEGGGAIRRAVKPLVPAALRARLRTRIVERDRFRPVLDPALRREITERLRPDILALQELIGRDLSRWLEPAPPRR